MEEKERLIKRVNDVKKDNKIIQEMMVIENNRLREEDIFNTAMGEARRAGREEGIKEGIEQGIKQKEFEVIKNMLAKGTNNEYISEVTGKTLKEIKEIENRI